MNIYTSSSCNMTIKVWSICACQLKNAVFPHDTPKLHTEQIKQDIFFFIAVQFYPNRYMHLALQQLIITFSDRCKTFCYGLLFLRKTRFKDLLKMFHVKTPRI